MEEVRLWRQYRVIERDRDSLDIIFFSHACTLLQRLERESEYPNRSLSQTRLHFLTRTASSM